MPARVLFIGLDAAEARFLERGAAQGHFPNIARALAEAAVSVSGTIETSFVEHAYIEPEAGWAAMDGDTLVICACTQAPYMDRDDTAAVLGLVLHAPQVQLFEEIEPAIAALKADGVQGMVVGVTPPLFAYQKEIADLALKFQLPAIAEQPEFAEHGGLLSYGVSIFDVAHRQAYFVDRILKGAKPADLPVEQLPKPVLLINLKTAKTLGLTVPALLLVQADKVIE